MGAKKFQSDMDAQIQAEPQVAGASTEQGVNVTYQNSSSTQANTSAANNLANRTTVKTNNENSPPKIVDYYIKRPKACNLLDVRQKHHFCAKTIF